MPYNHLNVLLNIFPDGEWDWDRLGKNPGLSWGAVIENPGAPWDWDWLSTNRAVAWEDKTESRQALEFLQIWTQPERNYRCIE